MEDAFVAVPVRVPPKTAKKILFDSFLLILKRTTNY